MRDLSRADFLDILEVGQVDTGSGTLFGVANIRPVEKSKLTLVIGIGGSGNGAVLRAFSIAEQKLCSDYSGYVKFLAVDADSNELDRLDKKGLDIFDLSIPGADYRLEPECRSPFSKSFINEDFPNRTLTGYGSNQRRLMGKSKLYDGKDGATNDQLLRDKIAGYFDGDWTALKEKPVDIIVITGITGGTGSGTFIDIAALARSACPCQSNVTLYGYIMLPDTMERIAITNDVRKRLFSNGFAALKELESFESINMEEGRKEIFPAVDESNSIEISKPIFDYPVLVSGNYVNAAEMIAEVIINAVADSDGTFGQASLYQNRDVQRAKKLKRDMVSRDGILKHETCPEDSHMFSSIGYAQASIPEKIVIPHVVGAVCKRLYEPAFSYHEGPDAEAASFCTKERPLNREEYEAALRELLGLKQDQELNAGSLWSKLNICMCQLCRIKDNPLGAINLRGLQGHILFATEEMVKAIETEFDSMKVRAKGIMKKYGPRAMQFLFYGTETTKEHSVNEEYKTFCLKTQIEFVEERFINQKAEVMPQEPKLPTGFLQAIKAQVLMDEWKGRVSTYLETNIRYGVSQYMKGEEGVWQTRFVKPLKDFLWGVSRFADVLETVSDFYSDIGKSLDSDDYFQFMQQSGEANGINLCRNERTYAWVKEKISRKLANIRIQDVKDELIDDFYCNKNAWTSNDKGIARKAFDKVISRVCAVGKYAMTYNGNGMGLAITDYFSYVIDTEPVAVWQREIIAAVNLFFDQLITESKPCLKVKRGTVQACNGTIILPQALQAGVEGAMIQQAFQTRLIGMNTAVSNLVYSAVTDSIVCCQTSVADALSDLQDLTKWEAAYDSALDSTTHLHNGEIPTLHMVTGYSQYNELTMSETIREACLTEKRKVYHIWRDDPGAKEKLNTIYGTGLSWKNYPSINVSRYGSDFLGLQNTVEASYRRDVFSKKIEEALHLGIIECERTGNT